MRATQWMITLFLATSLCTASAIAADAAPAAAQAPQESKLESISGTAAGNDHEDCPVHHSKKECQHKSGEPCPHHQDAMHQGKSHEKCDHEQHS